LLPQKLKIQHIFTLLVKAFAANGFNMPTSFSRARCPKAWAGNICPVAESEEVGD
jgi:hypothetical protein